MTYSYLKWTHYLNFLVSYKNSSINALHFVLSYYIFVGCYLSMPTLITIHNNIFKFDNSKTYSPTNIPYKFKYNKLFQNENMHICITSAKTQKSGVIPSHKN